MRTRDYVLLFVLPTALSGCPGDPAGDSTGGSSTDGGSTDGGTAADPTGGAPFDGVIAPVVRTYRPLSGPPVEAVYDPLSESVEAAIVVGAQTFPAVYDGSSRLEFAGVPEVTYTLRRQYPPYPSLSEAPGVLALEVTDVREIAEFAGTYSGRPDVATTKTLTTKISLTASGMAPLGEDDAFDLYSYNADVNTFLYPSLDPLDGSSSPQVGATELAGWTAPWQPGSTRSGWPLVDPGKGDDLWLAHLVSRPLVAQPTGDQALDAWSYAKLVTLRSAARMSLQPMVAGVTAALTGAFEPVPEKKVTADFRLSQFQAELNTLQPFVQSLSCNLFVYLEPGVERPILGMIPYLGWARAVSRYVPLDPLCPPDACDPDLCAACDETYVFPGDRVVSWTYGNPFPGGTESMLARCRLSEYVTHPESGADEILYAYLEVSGTLAELTKGPIVPKLGIVGDIRINGAPSVSSDLLTDVGPTPTISFAPPAFGAPDEYVVSVITLEDIVDDNGDVLDQYRVASVATTGTSVQLPPGVLQQGSYYYLQIYAQRGQEANSADWYTHDQWRSAAYSGVFAP